MQLDAGQIAAAEESARADGGYAVGHDDAGDDFVFAERRFGNPRYRYAVDFSGDDDIGVRAGIAGDGEGAVRENLCGKCGGDDIALSDRPVIGIAALGGGHGELAAARKGVVRNGGQRLGQDDFRQRAVGKGARLDGRRALGNDDPPDGRVAAERFCFNHLKRGGQGQRIDRVGYFLGQHRN